MKHPVHAREAVIPLQALAGGLSLPAASAGLAIFAFDSSARRLSPHSTRVARALIQATHPESPGTGRPSRRWPAVVAGPGA
jgi:hypothetical protein